MILSIGFLSVIVIVLLLQNYTLYAETEKFDYIDRRLDFCSIHYKVERGEIPIKDALMGLNLSAGHIDEIDVSSPTMSKRVLDEMAARGGFNIDYIIMGRPAENETYTDMLLKSINYTDIGCAWWERRLFRLDLGVVFMEEFYEADTVMIQRPFMAKQQHTFHFWAFTRPFSPALWTFICFIIVLTGVVYYFLDFISSRAKNKDTDASFIYSIFFSFQAFTGHCNYNAKSRASQILTTSMCFLYLIIISAYTANLAKFFVVSKSPQLKIEDIEDVVNLDLQICSVRGYPNTEMIQTKYPNAKLILQEDEQETMKALSSQECDIGLIALENWKTLRRDNRYNKECTLSQIGRRLDTIRAGFAFRDSSSSCSSVLINALNYHLITMKLDGTLEQLWEMYRESKASLSCETRTVTNQHKSYRVQLNVINMSGAFMFHLCFVFIALLMAIFDWYMKPKGTRKKIFEDFSTSFQKTISSMQSSSTTAPVRLDSSLREKNNSFLSDSSRLAVEFTTHMTREQRTDFAIQEQMLLSHKIEHMKSLLMQSRSMHARKLDSIIRKVQKNYNEQQEEMEDLKKQIRIAEIGYESGD